MNSQNEDFLPVGEGSMRFSSTKDIPKNAVILTPTQVLQIHTKAIKKWEPPSDMYPVKYGAAICGGVAAISGLLFNNYYRNMLQLHTFGRMSTLLPGVALPGAITSLLHGNYILQPLLLGKFDCPTCVEIRAVSLQLISGFIYPIVICPMACAAIAKRYNTYPLPIAKESGKLFWGSMLKPYKTVTAGIFALQLLTAATMTYLEGLSFEKLTRQASINIKESLEEFDSSPDQVTKNKTFFQ